MGRKSSSKKSGSKVSDSTKLLPQSRNELDRLVNEVFKRCTKVPPLVANNPTDEWKEFLELYEIIEKIQVIEKGIRLPSYNRQEQIEPFLIWIQEHGIEMEGVEIADFGHRGLGLRSTVDIPIETRVISVPYGAMITEESAQKSYLGPLIEREQILSQMGNVCLSIYLLGEYVDQKSMFQPYLRILPQGNYSTALYFTPDELQALKGSIISESIKLFRNIARQYSYFYGLLKSTDEARSWPIKDYFTFDAYRWAVSTVMTRLNRVPVSGSTTDRQLALIPGWDMANHEQGQLSTDYDDVEQKTICLAHRDFKKGEEFTIYYGHRSNSELFLHNGFVYPNNNNDSLTIKLGVSKSDSLYELKKSLLSILGLQSSGSFFITRGPHPISKDLLAFTRIFNMDEDALTKWLRDGEKAKGLCEEDCDVGTMVQDKTWKFLHTRIILLLKTYPTTLEEDEASLNVLMGAKAMIKTLLICEKRILRDALVFLSSYISK